MDNSKAFAKGTPSAFIIDTPFQLLCAVEAISEFAISDYIIIAFLEKDGARNNQLFEMLNDMHLKYEVKYVEDNTIDYLLTKIEYFRCNIKKKYSRIFIGDYFATEQWALSSIYATNGSVCVFLDDGNSTIDLLSGKIVKEKPKSIFERKEWKKGTYKPTIDLRNRIQNKWRSLGIDGGHYIFTLYTDINTRLFDTYPNKFKNMSSYLSERNQEGVYIIGTVSFAFCNAMSIKESEYEGILWQQLSEIKDRYNGEKIVYIPHGRDSNQNTPFFCKQLGIEYLRLHSSVEFYFFKNKINAKSIYGFSSTALLSLKKMLPDTQVVNWFIDNNQAQARNSYKKISKYYSKHSIDSEKIYYKKLPIYKFIFRLAKRIFGL